MNNEHSASQKALGKKPVVDRKAITVATANSRARRLSIDEETKNYSSEGDSTASGGYGSANNVWSDKAQRGNESFLSSIQERYTPSSSAANSPWNSYPGTPRISRPATPVFEETSTKSGLRKEVRDAQAGGAIDSSLTVGA
ncbi:carbohydrate esterase family 8 protein [Moniliophthora roreri]|uniref:Uncharacterized protein n=1 Tax=Moniliophthora roreri TaxID=221103 RepID=A0A0W0EYT8_MONRR|nr:carbohydrate esterase family 8 protein [Moniliophthora roreri]